MSIDSTSQHPSLLGLCARRFLPCGHDLPTWESVENKPPNGIADHYTCLRSMGVAQMLLAALNEPTWSAITTCLAQALGLQAHRISIIERFPANSDQHSSGRILLRAHNSTDVAEIMGDAERTIYNQVLRAWDVSMDALPFETQERMHTLFDAVIDVTSLSILIRHGAPSKGTYDMARHHPAALAPEQPGLAAVI